MDIKDTIKAKFEAVKKILLAVDTPPVPTPEPTPVVEPVKLASTEYTLADGTILNIDNVAVGGAVLNGEMPAADGSYTLPTGDEITVVGGLITVATPAAAEAVEPVETEMKKDVVAMQSHIKTLEVKLAKMDNVEARFAAQTKQIESLTSANKLLFEAVELMSNESKSQPLEKEKSFENLSPLEKFRAAKN